MAEYRVRWIEVSNVPGNFGWADSVKMASSMAEAVNMAEEKFPRGVTKVQIAVRKENGGWIDLGERKCRGVLQLTARGHAHLDADIGPKWPGT